MPSKPSPAEAALAELLGIDLEAVFTEIRRVEAIEDAIGSESERHPEAADLLFHARPLLEPTHEAMRNVDLHLGHARELLARVAVGADTRPATAAEVCIGLSRISQLTPMQSSVNGLYFRMWLQTGMPDVAGIATASEHHEALESSLVDEHEALTRRKLAVSSRVMGNVECDGFHYGKQVKCSYSVGNQDRKVTIPTHR
ncbi:hypothetical protein [Glycomyces sp. YM15]|uniref:hypothetical protein n=1 Tax=Glycomyces sp. YM15 TaxID=2800446 RepID=UPI0019667D73|nr:hypothetical protein [Glycomyces sp. YM15]